MKKFLVLALLLLPASTALAGQDAPTLNEEKAQIVEWFIARNHQILIEELPAATENRTHKTLAQKDRKQDSKVVVAQTEKAKSSPNTAP